jgi:predicted lipase
MKIPTFLISVYSALQKYNDTIAKRNFQLAAATYCSAAKIQSWDCVHCLPGITIQDAIIGDTNIIVANDAMQNATVFAFRGSVDIQNWISNFEFEFTSPYPDPAIKVHKGLHQEYLKYKDALFQYLPTPNDKVIITGHSSGAALSMFMAYDIYKSYDVSVYTFGKPRIGNDAFVKSAKPIQHYRVTHHNDIVPHVPEELFGYQHTDTEIWYYNDGDKYKTCETNEDPECSNSCAPIHCDSISDHLYYMGTNIGSEYC